MSNTLHKNLICFLKLFPEANSNGKLVSEYFSSLTETEYNELLSYLKSNDFLYYEETVSRNNFVIQLGQKLLLSNEKDIDNLIEEIENYSL